MKENHDFNLKVTKSVKTRYFDIHVNNGDGQSFSVFIRIPSNIADKADFFDKINYAVKIGKLDIADMKGVDNLTEIDKAEFDKASKA